MLRVEQPIDDTTTANDDIVSHLVNLMKYVGLADKLNTHGLAPGNKSLTGVFGAEMGTQRLRDTIAGLLEKMAAGTLHIPIDRTFSLELAAAAHSYIETRQAVGRVILVP